MLLNGLVYVGGGTETGWNRSYTIFSYDPVNNLWSSAINTPYSFFAMTTLNNNLLIAGGMDKNHEYTNHILRLNADHFMKYNMMHIARSSSTAVGYQGMLIITGGYDDKSNKLSSTELLDSNNGQWYTCSDLPRPHSWLQPVIVDNMLYLLGGINNDGASTAVFTTLLDSLSAHKLKWNAHKNTPWPNLAPVSVCGKVLLIIRGNKSMLTSNVYKLNKINQSWDEMGCIPSPREAPSAVATSDNRIIVIGGLNDNEEISKTVWIGSCEPQ